MFILLSITAFAKCAKEQGWMVVFKCRDENRALNKCLEQYTNEEKREEWLRAKGCEPWDVVVRVYFWTNPLWIWISYIYITHIIWTYDFWSPLSCRSDALTKDIPRSHASVVKSDERATYRVETFECRQHVWLWRRPSLVLPAAAHPLHIFYKHKHPTS